jgi:ABC-type multidrug transport system fused ATPase/permease subunit
VAEGARLQARDLSLRRAGRLVLDGASLHLAPGSVTALIAPSGSGKSTLLRCCNGLLRPDAGEVRLDGVPIADLDPRALRRRVGLVAQHPHMLAGTVADNVRHGVPEADVAAALAAAGLGDDMAARPAARLSGGEQARVAIARALSRSPDVLLLDEPTAALDADAAGHLGATLRDLAGRGLAVCAATHDLAWAETVADRRVELAAPGTP